MRVDSVLVARDLDGDGHSDSVVVESRLKPGRGLVPRRVAVRLGRAASVEAPTWASGWDDESEPAVLEMVPVDANSTLLAIDLAQADYDAMLVVLVERGRARTIVRHGIDYGEGDFRLADSSGTIVLLASQPHLEIDERAVEPPLECPVGQWAMIRATFDRAMRRFVPGQPRCTKRAQSAAGR